MSKLFINEPGYSRISQSFRPELIDIVTKDLRFRLSDAFTMMQPNYELDFKEDYGDLDLITLCPTNVDISKMLRENEGCDYYTERNALGPASYGPNFLYTIEKVTTNGNVISFLFRIVEQFQDSAEIVIDKAYHIDIIRCSSKLQFKNMITYYRNGVVNNFLGQFLRAFKIKAGHNGIYYLYIDKRKNTVEIPFMDDYHQFFLDYFGIDLQTLVFQNFEELSNYLISVPFFCGVDRYIETNSSDKKRAMKLHGLANQLYRHIEGLTEPQYQTSTFEMVLKPEHQNIVDTFIKDYELKLDINHSNRKSLFEFLEFHGVSNTYFKDIFSVMMPILNKVKLDKHILG